jgi:hypothetical protein
MKLDYHSKDKMKRKLLSWEKEWNKTNPFGYKVVVKKPKRIYLNKMENIK